MNRWKGRIAIVCDFAGSNTTLTICKDLVKYGLSVLALTTRDGIRQFDKLEKELSANPMEGSLTPMECDVRYEEHVNPVFRFIGERYGGVDLLINYVNSMKPGMILEDDNTANMRHTMETNVFGLCFVLREAAKLMRQRPEERKDIGHIVNIISAIGDALGIVGKAEDFKPDNQLYPATKWADDDDATRFQVIVIYWSIFICRNAAIAINECIRQELLYFDMENVKITVSWGFDLTLRSCLI